MSNGRNVVRMPQPQMPSAQPQWGGWQGGPPQWCSGDPCDDAVPPFPCPPPGWPPPGCPPWYSGQNSPPWYPGANAGVSFGATPPPNPVRGHMWWDGTTMWLFDGAAWSAIGGEQAAAGGATYGPTPPPSPVPGTLWFDGADLLIWTGTAWIPATGSATGPTPPSNPAAGALWWNGSTLMVWDGTAWVAVSATKSYIQSTPPPSPNPGDTWWNGTQMYIWSGTAWMLVGPGAIPGPIPTSTEVFGITIPGALSIGAGYATWALVPFTSVPILDTLSAWTAGNYKFQPNKAGTYGVMARMYSQYAGTSGTPAGFGIQILKNDSGGSSAPSTADSLVAISWSDVTSSFNAWEQAFGLVYLNGTSDYIRMWASSSSGTIYGSGANPVFACWLFP